MRRVRSARGGGRSPVVFIATHFELARDVAVPLREDLKKRGRHRWPVANRARQRGSRAVTEFKYGERARRSGVHSAPGGLPRRDFETYPATTQVSVERRSLL